MKYSERDNLVADLRELADLIEERGHRLPIELYRPFRLTTRFYGDDAKARLVKAAKNIGNATKDYKYSDFELVRTMTNDNVQLRFETNRENVCVKKVIGTEKVQKTAYVEIPGEFIEQEIVEWECDPLLT